MRRGPVRHMFVEDPGNTDPVDRRQWCARCYLPATNAIHNLPPRTDEQRQHEQRRTGERA